MNGRRQGRIRRVLLRVLLRVLPPHFRERHGREILELLDAGQEGRPLPVRVWLCLRTALDVALVGVGLRFGAHPSAETLLGRVRPAGRETGRAWSEGLRTVRRAPGFAVLVILIVALGVGASSVVFSVANTLLIRPLPFAHPEELVWISNGEWGRGQALSEISAQVAHLQDIQQGSRTLQDVAGFHLFDRAGDHTLHGYGPPLRLTRLRATPNFLPLLGIEPLHGRHFDARESRYGGPSAILLTHDLWVRRFEADPAVVGHSITIDDEPVTVVGVLPSSFDFPAVFAPGTRTDYVAPFPLSPETHRTGNTLALIARREPGVSMDVVQEELESIAAQHRGERLNAFSPRARPLRAHVGGTFRSATMVLAVSVALVMLIVCANLANLLLARGTHRRRELAVRAALGAGRGRLAREVLAESLVLALAGGALGLALAHGGTRLLAGLDTTIPLLSHVRVDPVVLAFALAASVATGLVFGVLPALGTSLVSPYEAMRSGGRGHSTSRSEGRLRRSLVVGEVAVACLLVVGAGLLLRSFLQLTRVDLGFEPNRTVALRIDPTTPFEAPEEELAYYDSVLEAVRSIPGVESAGLTDVLPVGFNRRWCVDAPGAGTNASACDEAAPYVRLVSDGYLEAMGITVLAGRGITAGDRRTAPPAVLVNDVLAELLWPGREPVGQVLRIWDGVDWTVVGVTRGMRHLAPDQPPGPEVFFPLHQLPNAGQLHVIARARPGVSLTSLLAPALASIAAGVPIEAPTRVETIVDSATSPRRLLLGLVLGFAVTALGLASLGIYGVISYSVARRRRELGIRMALGAGRRSVRAGVLVETARLTGLGLLLGLVAAWVAGRLLESQLYGVAPSDLPTFLAAGVGLAVVAAFAGYVPAYRASSVDPVSVLAADA